MGAATVFFDCFSFLIQFATWVRTRWRVRNTPPSPGVFRAPIGFLTLVLWVSVPTFLCILVIVLSAREPGVITGVILSAILGEALYAGQAFCTGCRRLN